ncbi:AAA family ATPase [Thermanaerosceptrum fracticalcis]|uniref:AAA family ATPase n=1 Tax=Thermanaerosceptrum fracticalcis TaxID=1712410 RepID=A0A7G6E2S1_THEFR|nr:phosphoenolpyruvate hydrolase family protein [Thermanaerosceptrum fracticalcis]QNB46375.1 AAA family ATPase [Thermanaerosceptrum fracticalcis]
MLTYHKIKENLRETLQKKKNIVGAAVGSGLSARLAVSGGADLLLALNSGRFRNAGRSSMAGLMPFKNCNQWVLEFGSQEIIPVVQNIPIIFGACASDPTIDWDYFLDLLLQKGFHGINNFPSVGLIDGVLREALEEQGMGFANEVELISRAHRKGLFTVAFVFDPEQGEAMARVGADVICAHFGFTVGGSLGAKKSVSIENAAALANNIFSRAAAIRKDCFWLVYGGPVIYPEQADYIFKHTGAQGYIGGSSIERIPAEEGIREITDQFKNIVRLQQENVRLKEELERKMGFDEIVGQSRVMQELYNIVRKVADEKINILVYGESGTGKELVTRAIHYNSKRRDGPFIKVNCAALPENLLESELFGHEKGAFTGALQQRLGRFELAHKGTLFLDEIGEMSLLTQAKLLRVIQQQEFERVGGSKTIRVDARIICATNKDLWQMVKKGEFREDLYYRLNVVSIYTPPLRQHKEDIPLLVNHFLAKTNDKFNRQIARITPEALECLLNYEWPGNVRELQNVIERAVILCEGKMITLADLPQHLRQHTVEEKKLRENVSLIQYASTISADMEKKAILEALEKFHWHRTNTANYLGISRRTLLNKINKYGLGRH